MRHLLEPRTLTRATLAAAGTTLACCPRLLLWNTKQFPLHYLLFTIFVCCIVLWSFVLGWHKPYTGRPIFAPKFDPKLFSVVTAAGIVLSAASLFWLDPKLRAVMPEDYPVDLIHWLAKVLFLIAFWQLFLIFAPYDWLMRLCRNETITMVLTAAFGASVIAMKLQPHAEEISTPMFTCVLAGRFLGGFLAVFFYLRGGMALAWWWALIFELRLLPELL